MTPTSPEDVKKSVVKKYCHSTPLHYHYYAVLAERNVEPESTERHVDQAAAMISPYLPKTMAKGMNPPYSPNATTKKIPMTISSMVGGPDGEEDAEEAEEEEEAAARVLLLLLMPMMLLLLHQGAVLTSCA